MDSSYILKIKNDKRRKSQNKDDTNENPECKRVNIHRRHLRDETDRLQARLPRYFNKYHVILIGDSKGYNLTKQINKNKYLNIHFEPYCIAGGEV